MMEGLIDFQTGEDAMGPMEEESMDELLED